ncbi:MAG: dihydrofolate reductase [Cyclobacteriaceae bacterium]
MKISIIAAIGANRAIGKDNDMIWHLPDDMKFFKEKTTGHTVVMGRLNYDSLPSNYRPLPNRTNLVLTTNEDYEETGVHVFHDIEKAIESAREAGEKELFIIGGGQIYEIGMKYTDRMYLTEIKESFEADVFFPEYDKSKWEEIVRVPHSKDERHAYEFDFVTYDRK